jgi:hypothetical protein
MVKREVGKVYAKSDAAPATVCKSKSPRYATVYYAWEGDDSG